MNSLLENNKYKKAEILIPSLSNAIELAIQNIKKLDIEATPEEIKDWDQETVVKSFKALISSFNEYSTDRVEKYITRLAQYIKKEKMVSILNLADRFEYDEAKEEVFNLALEIGIELEKKDG